MHLNRIDILESKMPGLKPYGSTCPGIPLPADGGNDSGDWALDCAVIQQSTCAFFYYEGQFQLDAF